MIFYKMINKKNFKNYYWYQSAINKFYLSKKEISLILISFLKMVATSLSVSTEYLEFRCV